MGRVVKSILFILLVFGIMGFAGGFFTGETHREEACPICRAVRYSGRHYGFSYERVEDSFMTRWYRQHIDPRHGLDPAHPHTWMRSACTTSIQPFTGKMDYVCYRVAPIFLLRPEVQLEFLQQVPDKMTEAALIRSLTVGDRRLSTQRIRRIIEWYHVDRKTMTWPQWWYEHAVEFGLPQPPKPVIAQP